jgi:putative membrane protein (TIGR04086 family)
MFAGLIALFVYFTAVREQQVAAGLFVAGVLAVVAGGAYAAHRARCTGWLHGGLVGGTYALITIALAPLLFPGSLGFGTVVERLVLGCAAGILGGVLGINI